MAGETATAPRVEVVSGVEIPIVDPVIPQEKPKGTEFVEPPKDNTPADRVDAQPPAKVEDTPAPAKPVATDPKPAPAKPSARMVPYSRFEEVVEIKNTLKEQVEQYKELVSEFRAQQQEMLRTFAGKRVEKSDEELIAEFQANPAKAIRDLRQDIRDSIIKEEIEPRDRAYQEQQRRQAVESQLNFYRTKYADFKDYEVDMQGLIKEKKVPWLDMEAPGAIDQLYRIAKESRVAEGGEPTTDPTAPGATVPHVESGRGSSGRRTLTEEEMRSMSAAELEQVLPRRAD